MQLMSKESNDNVKCQVSNVKCQKSNVNKVEPFSERTSKVSPVIHFWHRGSGNALLLGFTLLEVSEKKKGESLHLSLNKLDTF